MQKEACPEFPSRGDQHVSIAVDEGDGTEGRKRCVPPEDDVRVLPQMIEQLLGGRRSDLAPLKILKDRVRQDA